MKEHNIIPIEFSEEELAEARDLFPPTDGEWLVYLATGQTIFVPNAPITDESATHEIS